jgi:D-alanyl-lipoteichoic acid acyltransferase DltB (MBOAT superfamily)
LPNFLSAVIGLIAFLALLLAYVFGRVALQVSAGKFLLKQFRGDSKHSESIALFIGAFFWTALLSVPYVWIFALLILFVASLGIVMTSRSPNNWQKI